MGEIPTTTNKTLGAVESAINSSVMGAIAPVVENIISTVPALSWLKLPVVNTLFTWGMNWLFQQISVALQVCGVRLVITIQTNEEQSSYLAAEGALRKALQSGDANEIAKAEALADQAAANLIHYDGSSVVIR